MSSTFRQLSLYALIMLLALSRWSTDSIAIKYHHTCRVRILYCCVATAFTIHSSCRSDLGSAKFTGIQQFFILLAKKIMMYTYRQETNHAAIAMHGSSTKVGK